MLWRIRIFINLSICLSCFFQVVVGRNVKENANENEIENSGSLYNGKDQKQDDTVGQSNIKLKFRGNADAKGENTDCWMTLDAFKHHDAMDSIDSQYENVRNNFKTAFNEKDFDKAMLKAMIENRAVAKRALYNALGNSTAVPAGINLGGNGVMRTKDALLFFNRMKLRNDTHFRVKFVKSDMYNMVLRAHISLNDLHLVGDYQRVHTDIDPSNLFYRPTLGSLEILLRDCEYTMEGRYILRGDRFMVEHVISNIAIKGALISYMNDQKKPTKTSPIDINNFLDTLKTDLNDWLKDYFNDYLIYLPRAVDSKVQAYDKEKTLALNDYIDSALRGLKQRQKKLGLTNIALPVFNIYTVNGIAMQLSQGYVSGLDSIYRRSVATTLHEKETRKVDAIVGFSNLKCIYKYEVVLGPGSPRLAGTLIMTANELTTHMSIILLKEPAAADLKFSLLKQLKPEFLTIQGPANAALSNYKTIVERQIVALMVNSLHFTVFKLRFLIKCDPTSELQGVSFGEPRNEGDPDDDVRTTRMPDELSPPEEPYASTTPNPGKESSVSNHPKHSDTEAGPNDYVLNKDSSIEFVVPGKGHSEEKVHVKHKESYIIRRDAKHRGQASIPETIDHRESKGHSPAQEHQQEIPPQPQDVDEGKHTPEQEPVDINQPQPQEHEQEIPPQPQDIDEGKHTPEQEPVDINQLQPQETGDDNYALNKDSSIEMLVPGKSGNEDKVHVKHKESYLISRDPNHKGQASNSETIDHRQPKEHSPAQEHIPEISPQPQDVDGGKHTPEQEPVDINQPQPQETVGDDNYALNKDSSIEMLVPGKSGNEDKVHVKHKESYLISRDPNHKGQASNSETIDHRQQKEHSPAQEHIQEISPQPQDVNNGPPAEPDRPKSDDHAPEQVPVATTSQPQTGETGAGGGAEDYVLNKDSSIEMVVPGKTGNQDNVHVKHKESYVIRRDPNQKGQASNPTAFDHPPKDPQPQDPQPQDVEEVAGHPAELDRLKPGNPAEQEPADINQPQPRETGAAPDGYALSKDSSIELVVPDKSGKERKVHVEHKESYLIKDINDQTSNIENPDKPEHGEQKVHVKDNENNTLDRNVIKLLSLTPILESTHHPHSQEIRTAKDIPQSKELLSVEDKFTTNYPPFVEITTTKDSATTTSLEFDKIVTARDSDHPQSEGNISAKDTIRTGHQQSAENLNDNYVLNRDSSIENYEETVHLKHAKHFVNLNTIKYEGKKFTSWLKKPNRRHDNFIKT